MFHFSIYAWKIAFSWWIAGGYADIKIRVAFCSFHVDDSRVISFLKCNYISWSWDTRRKRRFLGKCRRETTGKREEPKRLSGAMQINLPGLVLRFFGTRISCDYLRSSPSFETLHLWRWFYEEGASSSVYGLSH